MTQRDAQTKEALLTRVCARLAFYPEGAHNAVTICAGHCDGIRGI